MCSLPMEGIAFYEETTQGFSISRTNVTTARAAENIGRAVGEYVVVHTGRLCRLETPFHAGDCLANIKKKQSDPQ